MSLWVKWCFSQLGLEELSQWKKIIGRKTEGRERMRALETAHENIWLKYKLYVRKCGS